MLHEKLEKVVGIHFLRQLRDDFGLGRSFCIDEQEENSIMSRTLRTCAKLTSVAIEEDLHLEEVL